MAEDESSGGSGCLTWVFAFGTTLGVVLSYDRNHSLLWAIFHGVLGWFYVAYRVVMHLLA